MPKVLNKRTDKTPPDAVYVGRPSKWGNPFKVESHTEESHFVAVNKYRVYAKSHLAVEPDWLDELKGKDLVCWCTPLPCHADILLQLANEVESDIEIRR